MQTTNDVIADVENTPPPTQPIELPQNAPPQGLPLSRILRDVVLVFLLTALGGFVASIATRGLGQHAHRFTSAIVVSNLLLGSVGFTVVGCLAPSPRWPHLGRVAVGVWLAGLINVVFFGVSIGNWIASLVFVAITMGIGGAISFRFKPDSQPAV